MSESDPPAFRPKFGDLCENGWSTPKNPTHRGYFVEHSQAGFRLTDGKGKFWIARRLNHKMTIIEHRIPPTP